MTYRCMFTTREKRRARTYTYTLAIDLAAGSKEQARRLLDERWPNHRPLPHRYNVSIEPTTNPPLYRTFTRVDTQYVNNRYITYLKHN